MNTLDDMKALGCSNCAKITMAHQTYLELTAEHECYTDVTYSYDDELDVVYLQGWRKGSQSTFIPIHSSCTLSLNWLRTVRSKLCQDEEKSVILVIRDADSSCVHYKLSEGLIMPPVTSNRSLRKGSDNKKSKKKRKISDPTIVATK